MRRSTREFSIVMMGLALMSGCYAGYEKAAASYAAAVKRSSQELTAEFDLALSICQQRNRVYLFQKRLTAEPPAWGHDGYLADELTRLRAPDYKPAQDEQDCEDIVKVSALHHKALRALAAYAHALQALADSDAIFGDSIKDTIDDAAKLALALSGNAKTTPVTQFATALASPLDELAKLTAGAWAKHKLKEQIAEADGPIAKLVDALKQYVGITDAQVRSLESVQTGVLQTLEQQMADRASSSPKASAPIFGAISVAELYNLGVQWDSEVRNMRAAQSSYAAVLDRLKAAHSDLGKAGKRDRDELKALVQKVGNDLYTVYSESTKLRKALSALGGAS